MTPVVSYDWLYHSLGAILALAALVLFFWSLFSDRSRGRRRCPKCWYDLAGVAAVTCPECGSGIRDQKRLYRTRRRWRWAAVGAAIALAGVATALVPAWRHGWERVVPSTLLAWWAPSNPPVFVTARRTGPAAAPGVPVLGGLPVLGRMFTPPPRTVSERLTDEAWRRIDAGSMWSWQARTFVGRYARAIGFDLSDQIIVPDRWVVGEPLKVSITGPTALGGLSQVLPRARLCAVPGPWSRFVGSDLLGAPTAVADSVELDLELLCASRVVLRTRARFPVEVVPDLASLLDPIDDPATTALVQRALAVRVSRAEDGSFLARVGDRRAGEPWESITMALVYRLELLADGAPVASGRAQAEWRRPVWKDWEDIPLAWMPDGPSRAGAAARLTLVVRGDLDADAAAQTYLRFPFSSPSSYWTGRFKIELDAAAVLPIFDR